MANLIMFAILAVVILGSAIICVTTKRIMRAATFLLFVLFGVAGLYFLLDYTYLGAAQISVYAGGVTMIYIFAIQLVSKRTLQGLVEHAKGSRVILGSLVTLAGFATVVGVFLKNQLLTISHRWPTRKSAWMSLARHLSVLASMVMCSLSSSFPYSFWHASSVES